PNTEGGERKDSPPPTLGEVPSAVGAAHEVPPPSAIATADQPTKPSSSRRWVWGLLLLAIVALLGVGGIAAGAFNIFSPAITEVTATADPLSEATDEPTESEDTQDSQDTINPTETINPINPTQSAVSPSAEASGEPQNGSQPTEDTITPEPTITPMERRTAPTRLPTVPPVPPLRFSYTGCANGNCDIYIFDLADNNVTQLTQEAALDQHAAWSPDGQQLVFVSDRSGNEQLYLYDLASQQISQQLTISGNNKVWPVWSPDGTQIAYQDYNNGGTIRVHLWALPIGSEDARQLTQPDPAWNKTPQWSAATDQIVFSAAPGDTNGDTFVSDDDQRHLYIMSKTGDNLRQSTSDPAYADQHPYWMPDGINILFSRHSKADLFANNGPGEIFILNSNSSELKALTFSSANETMAVPSPKGEHILIVRNENNTNNIYLATWDGTRLGKPTFIVEGNVPAWSPIE
ncbi:MAG: TolB family protein, partial [Ardenticatenaceae bacterium]